MAWGDKEYEARIAVEVEAERDARETLEKMVDENSSAIKKLWHWGNGSGGWLLEMCAERLGMPTYKTGSTGTKKDKIGAALRTQVYERDAYRCVNCGGFKDLTCDHKIPESKGGATTLDNLQTMCRPCNSSKGASQ